MPEKLTDISRLCIHSMTTKPLSLTESIEAYSSAGIPGITVWREFLDELGVKESATRLADSDLEVVSLCRGGFFPAVDASGREAALDENRRAIEQAATIGAPMVVLVCGAIPGQALTESRKQIQDALATLLPEAQVAGVNLAIEPLHPMYADDRSAVNTLGQANDMVEALAHPNVGIAADVYHLWWDPNLEAEIQRAGDSILAFHVSDWNTPTLNLMNDRALMGHGCINIPEIRGWVESVGFDGPIEVEIFSNRHWGSAQIEYLEQIKTAYLNYV